MKKRLLSIVMAMAMTMSLLPAAAFAAEPAPQQETQEPVVEETLAADAVVLTYTDADKVARTEKFATLKEAMKKADKLPSAVTDSVVTVAKDINEPSTYFYAYDANKVVINEGVTVTISQINKISSSYDKKGTRVTLINKGTINTSYIGGGTGTCTLENKGVINAGYIKSDIEGWVNSGTINLGWSNEDFASKLTSMNNTGIIKADHEGYEVTFTVPVEIKGTMYKGSMIWETGKWVSSAAFEVKKGTEVLGSYSNFNDAMAAGSNSGDTITVLRDTTISYPMIVDRQLKLDLASKTITFDGHRSPIGDKMEDGHIRALTGADLTITGNGKITYVKQSSRYELGISLLAWGNAKVTIENGTFESSLVCAEINDTATVTILGGQYSADHTYDGRTWLLNKKDAAKDTATFAVKGGIFVNFDPANSTTESPKDNFLAAGFSTMKNGNRWNVVPTPVVKAATLADNSGTIAADKLCVKDSYKVTCTLAESAYNVNISARNLKLHKNALNADGYWTGFAVTAPAGATQFKFAKAASADLSTAELNANEEIFSGVFGVAFYFDTQPGVTTKDITLQWFDATDNAIGCPITFHISFDVTQASETAAEVAPAAPLLWKVPL